MIRSHCKALRAVAAVSAFAFTGLARFFAGLFCYYRYYCGICASDRLGCPFMA